MRMTAGLLVAGLAACGRPSEAVGPAQHLAVWTASADTTQPDFLAVLDVTERGDTARYGAVVATVPVPGGPTMPHHTEHEMPADGRLFANGFAAGRTFIFDLTTPTAPRLAGEFRDVDGYAHPHSFVRLTNGNVLASFQMKHTATGMRAGGLVELTPEGALVRSSSADYAGADTGLRVYSSGVIPALDRVVTTSTDMAKDFEASRTVQVWRLSDLALLHSITLPHGPRGDEALFTAEPRLLADGRTMLVSTFNCGLYLMEGLETDAPNARLVASYPVKPGRACAIPVVAGRFYVMTVGAQSAVVSLDVSDPAHPREVSRVTFDSTATPHWIAMSPDRRRVVVTGYDGMQHAVRMLRFDAETGWLSHDERFRDAGATAPGMRLDDKTWPHGGSAKGIPHGAVFTRP